MDSGPSGSRHAQLRHQHRRAAEAAGPGRLEFQVAAHGLHGLEQIVEIARDGDLSHGPGDPAAAMLGDLATPEEVAACPESYTGQFLKKILG